MSKKAIDKADRTDDQKIIDEAKERFAECESWEAQFRALYEDDMKFVNADSDNKWQWPAGISKARELDGKPVLTINKTRQHCLQIENDAKQNKPGIVVHPSSDEASYEAAQVFEDIIRNIENRSHASNAYDKATETQVRAGYGVIGVITKYVDANTFDQEIIIRSFSDPLTVYFDPNAKESDKSDGKFAFVFVDMPKDRFIAEHPDFEDSVADTPIVDYGGWLSEKHVRVAEYWRQSTKPDKLISWVNQETGERTTIRKSKLGPELYKKYKNDGDPSTIERDVIDETIECIKIAGDEIIDRKEWAGQYIPLIPVIGEEIIIEGVMDRRGHTRAMKDPQRMYNYYSSAATETVALQSKTPYIAQAAAIEGYEDAWGMANRENMAYLPVNHLDDKGQPLQIPQRQPPPAMPDAMLKGMEYTQNELMMVSGQFQSQFGENENAKSGKAINARQRQGDNATYHFIDNQAIALRHLGRILINLIPAIYDTKRILRLRGKDGTKKSVMVDPQATQALQAVEDKANAEAEMIFNPAVGQYDVTADIGPSYATRRQEAWNAISQILAQNADLGHVVGDLLFKNADFPGAEEIAERIRRTIPPNILGDGPPPEMQKLQEQSAEQQKKMTGIIAELQAKIAEMTMRSQNKQNNDAVSVYDAESRRITALSNAKPELGLDTIKPIVERVLFEMASGGLANGNQPQSPQGGMSPQGAQMPMGGNGDQSDGDVAQGAGDPTQAPQDAPPPDMQQGMA